MAPALGIAATALSYMTAAYFATRAVAGDERGAPLRRSATRLALCIACAVAGVFAASRGVDLERLVVVGIIVGSLAGAAYARVAGGNVSFVMALLPLAATIVSAALDGAWTTIVVAAIVAVPFGLSIALSRRPSGIEDAFLSAVAGAALGLIPAILVLFVAAFATIALSRRHSTTVKTVAFAPSIAAATLVAVTCNLVIS